MQWRRKWQPPPVFLSGESQGRGSLVGCRLWGRTESYTTKAIQTATVTEAKGAAPADAIPHIETSDANPSNRNSSSKSGSGSDNSSSQQQQQQQRQQQQKQQEQQQQQGGASAAAELPTAEAVAPDTRRNGPLVLIVTGMAGSGKSTLVKAMDE